MKYSAVYYGTDKSGTHYFYSKNGADKPEITTLEAMQAANPGVDYTLRNYEPKK